MFNSHYNRVSGEFIAVSIYFLGVEYSNQKLKKYLSAVIHFALWSSRDQSPDV